MSAVFRNVPPTKPVQNSMPTSDLIRSRFDFYSAMLQNFAKYSQEVEGKSRAEVLLNVNRVADALIEKYKFGAKFIADIHTFIDASYYIPATAVLENIKNDAKLSDEHFNAFMSEFESSMLAEKFEGRFKGVFSKGSSI